MPLLHLFETRFPITLNACLAQQIGSSLPHFSIAVIHQAREDFGRARRQRFHRPERLDNSLADVNIFVPRGPGQPW